MEMKILNSVWQEKWQITTVTYTAIVSGEIAENVFIRSLKWSVQINCIT